MREAVTKKQTKTVTAEDWLAVGDEAQSDMIVIVLYEKIKEQSNKETKNHEREDLRFRRADREVEIDGLSEGKNASQGDE